MSVKIHKICIGCTVGCNYAIESFKRGFRYNIISFGFSNGGENWILKELSTEELEFSVNKNYCDLLIKNGNLKNL